MIPGKCIPNADYWFDNYGACRQGPKCQCLKYGWKGQSCLDWQPIGVKSLEELFEYVKKNYVKS